MNPTMISMAMASIAMAMNNNPVLEPGTEVTLRFNESVTSRNAELGENIDMVVAKDVMDDGTVVIPAGTPVVAEVTGISKRGVYGKNGRLEFRIQPIMTDDGMVLLEPRGKGQEFSGSRTDTAAVATGGGLLVLGPIGLLGGLFVQGKPMRIEEGMMLRTEVAQSMAITTTEG